MSSRRSRRWAVTQLAAAATLVLTLASAAQATSIRERTVRISVAAGGGDPDGPSRHPSLSGAGNLVAFDSLAANLTNDPNGAVSDVFVRDLAARRTLRVSRAPGGLGADGPSRAPALAHHADIVAFESDATNLVKADSNHVSDIFATFGRGEPIRVSVAHNGAQADGPSSAPDISEDGRFVVFQSAATNLVENDNNGHVDIFVRDLVANSTRLVSLLPGLEMDGDSTTPAISADGRYVSFTSTTTNLIYDDTNRKADVFVADLANGRIRRASTSKADEEQNLSVGAPFAQVSDVSRRAELVTFDSDATNLVSRDRNKDTDVFLKRRRGGDIGRVSMDVYGREGTNDSFFPRITPDGRYVAFQSFAANLSSDDAAREDIYVYDLRRFAPTLVNVGARGQRRAREHVRQLLQRPDITDDGQIVAFTSTAGNLVNGDQNRVEDVFIRLLAAPRARIVRPRGIERSSRVRLSLRADDPRARRFLCIIDNRVRIPCTRNGRLPALQPGTHTLRVQAGGAGMLYQPGRGARRAFTIRP